jgi:hypothetical protein
MGIDIYAEWTGMTEAEEDEQNRAKACFARTGRPMRSRGPHSGKCGILAARPLTVARAYI